MTENDEIPYEDFIKQLAITKEKAFDQIINDTNVSSETKITKTLEAEYAFIEQEQKNIIFSNDEMLRLMPNDLDAIESRAINLQCFNKNLTRLKEIKEKISIIAGKDHYIYRKPLPVFAEEETEEILQEITL